MIRRNRTQSGQVLVLLILGMVGMLGFTALAIDGGLVFAERRRAQNAADTSALAAALADINGDNLHVAALNRLASNGYNTTWGPCSPAGYDCTAGTATDWTVQVSSPPRSGEFAGLANYIQVEVTSTVNTSFVHFVYDGPVTTTVEAVSRVWPATNIAPGSAMFADNDHDCKGLWFSGTNDTFIQGGSAFSNSDADATNCESGVADGAGAVQLDSSERISVVGTFDAHDLTLIDPDPVEGATQVDLRNVPVPDCSGMTDYGKVIINGGTVTLQPGLYEEIKINGGDVTFAPGMYCIYGTKGFVTTGGTITGTGIMIYLENGDLSLSGNVDLNLSAESDPGVLVDPSHYDWADMLFYLDPSNTEPVTIGGGTGSAYTGTLYAPGSDCELAGSGDTLGLNSQMICDRIKLTGTSQITIIYNEDDNYHLPPTIDLAR